MPLYALTIFLSAFLLFQVQPLIAKTILPFNERSFAGRIRRGLIHVEGGDKAGNLHRTVGDVVAEARARAAARASAHGGSDRRGSSSASR